MRTWILLLIVLAGYPGSAFTAVDPHADSPDAQLLRAEILELSRGDLDGAMAIYRELADDESTGDAIRAKALLQLARCHRKRGELEVARRLFEQLVEKHTAQGEVIDQARGFLNELKQGRSDNPAFDWLETMVATPEIQERIFGAIMAMTLPGEAQDKGKAQLKALGGVVVPAVEKVAAATQDVELHEQLIRLLVELGRFEHLPTLFPGTSARGKVNWVMDRFDWLEGLDGDQRSEVHAALAQCVATPDSEYAFRLFRLAAGDDRTIREDLIHITNTDHAPGTNRVAIRRAISRMITRCAREHPSALSNLLLEKGQKTRPDDLDTIEPGMLLVEILHRESLPISVAQIENVTSDDIKRWSAMVRGWVETRDLPRLKAAGKHFGQNEDRRVNFADAIADLPIAEQAELFRELQWPYRLRILAERDDAAIEAFRAVIATVATGPLGTTRVEQMVFAQQSVENWQPSPKYAAALADWVRSKRPLERAIGLEGVGHAKPGIGPDVTDALIETTTRGNDAELRLMAAIALFRRACAGWPRWNESIRAIEQFLDASTTITWAELQESALTFETVWTANRRAKLGRRGASESQSVLRRAVAVLNPTREQLYSERSCAEQYRELFLDAVRETNPQVEGRNGDRTRFEDSLGRGFSSGCGFTLMGSDCIRWTESITDAFCTAIEGFSDTVALETAAAVFPHRVAMKSYPAKFVGATLSNPDVDLDARLHVLESVSRSSDQDARARAVLEQHDFVPIFASDDPMVPYIVRCFRLALKGSDRRIVYAKTLVENPRTQAIALKLFFETDPEYRAVMSEALASEDQGRISAAKASVLAGRTEVILPLLHEILAMDPHQTDTIDRLVEFADARSIEPLAKLLDSNDYSQRKVALEALEKIEDTLKKRSKWRGR